MTKHKNSNNALGNYCIYAIYINFKTFKIGKSDLDRKTKEGEPVRIYFQKELLKGILRFSRIDAEIIVELFNITTKEALKREKEELQKYFDKTGEIPEGNIKTFKPEK